MNGLICVPSLDQLDALYSGLINALTSRGREALVFRFSGEQALEEYLAVSPDPPDIIFLPLQLAQLHTLRASLKSRYPETRLVLTGAPPDDIEELFAMGALYFLYKPLREGSMNRFASFLSSNAQEKAERHLLLKEKQQQTVIPYSKILYIASDKRKISVHQPNGVCSEGYRKLDDAQEELVGRFVRCHQSFLVNMDYIRGITEESFQLVGDISVPISQKRYWASKRQYVEYIKSRG